MRIARPLSALALSTMSAACALVAGIEDITVVPREIIENDGSTADVVEPDGPLPKDDAGKDGGPSLPDCGAQRVVHIVAGQGGLAWFTVLFPFPNVITGFQVGYAYDDPAKAAKAPTDATHALYMRKRGTRYLWELTGANPLPTAFVVGVNQTHTNAPSTSALSTGIDVIAAGAALQVKQLAPPVPVITFDPALRFDRRPADPIAQAVTTIDDAINAIKAKAAVTTADEQALRPDPMKLAGWYASQTPPAKHSDLAARLLFAANAFKAGYVGTVLVPALRDDPHSAFLNGTVTAPADELASILDNFYAELAKSTEKACGRKGLPLSLADNTVVVITGDTPKNCYDTNGGWQDSSPGGANFVYIRSNGFLVPGWFGGVAPPNTRTNFDPATGALNAATPNGTTLNATLDGLLYAIARGDQSVVTAVDSTSYGGLRSPTPPQ